MKKYDYILVGSGLYSGVFAWFAKQKGKKCLVLEKRDHIGGNVYTFFFCEIQKVSMYTNTVPHFPYKQQRSMAVCKFTGRI